MRTHRRQAIVLALALLLGQWLAFAHGFIHAASAAPDAQCEFCVHAQGLDSAAPGMALASLALPPPATQSLPLVAAPDIARALVLLPPATGPPAFPV